MGIAIVLSNCDFSAKNLGKVTFLEDANLTGLTISGENAVNGITSTYSVDYLPANTSQRGVTWSIVSGATYANIDATTGLLTVLSGANASAVTIKATSTVDNTIVSTKNITVTYVAAPILLTSLAISGSSVVTGNTSQYTVEYTPANTTQQGVTWSIVSGSAYASIDATSGLLTVLSGANASAVTIKATSTVDNIIVSTKNITVTYSISPIYQLPSMFQGNGSSTYLDTGVKLYDDTAKEWTIIANTTVPLSLIRDCNDYEATYFHCFNEVSPYYGLAYRYRYGGNAQLAGLLVGSNPVITNLNLWQNPGDKNVIAISKDSNGNYTIYDNKFSTVSPTHILSAVTNVMNNTLHLGCSLNSSGVPYRFSNLIVNDLKIYDKILTDAQIKAILSTYEVTL